MNKKFLILIALVIFGYFAFFYGFSPTVQETKKVASDLIDQKEVTIEMINYKFEPAEVVISKGTKITWLNKDSVGHSVKSDSHPAHDLFPELNSPMLDLDGTFSVLFDKAGEYTYHCDPHSQGMKGKIIVK